MVWWLSLGSGHCVSVSVSVIMSDYVAGCLVGIAVFLLDAVFLHSSPLRVVILPPPLRAAVLQACNKIPTWL